MNYFNFIQLFFIIINNLIKEYYIFFTNQCHYFIILFKIIIIFSNFLKILPYNINVFFVSYLYNDETMVAMGLGNVILSLLECFILGISSLLNKPNCNSITPHELLNRGRLGVIIVLLPSVAIALCTEPLLKLIH